MSVVEFGVWDRRSVVSVKAQWWDKFSKKTRKSISCHWLLACIYFWVIILSLLQCLWSWRCPDHTHFPAPPQEKWTSHGWRCSRSTLEVQHSTHRLGQGSSSSVLRASLSHQHRDDQRQTCSPCLPPTHCSLVPQGSKANIFSLSLINRPHCCQSPNLWAPWAYARVHTLRLHLLLSTQDPC